MNVINYLQRQSRSKKKLEITSFWRI